MSISAVLCTVQVAGGVLCRMRVLSSEGMVMFCGVAEQKDGYEAFYEQTGQDDACRSTVEGIDAVSSMTRLGTRCYRPCQGGLFGVRILPPLQDDASVYADLHHVECERLHRNAAGAQDLERCG